MDTTHSDPDSVSDLGLDASFKARLSAPRRTAPSLNTKLPYKVDKVPAYNLDKEKLENFLVRRFGQLDSHITVRNDHWVFEVPRPLTLDEKDDLLRANISTAVDEAEGSVIRRPLPVDARPALQPPLETLEIDDSQTTAVSDKPSEQAISALSCGVCRLIYSLWFIVAAGSLAVGLWRSLVTEDEGKGFTDAAYVVAVGGLVMFPVHMRHTERCRRIVEGRG